MKYNYQFEEWRDIPEYFGLYQVSNFGRVRSLNYKRTGEKRILKPQKIKCGYLQVGLCKDGKVKMFKVHRLVAEAFIPNPENLPEVNHKNEIKDDNRVENLEFCDRKYNINYGTCIKRRAEKQSESMKGVLINRSDLSKSVNQFTNDGLLVAQYQSAKEAERQTGYAQSNICACCKGKIKQAYGYIWKFV